MLNNMNKQELKPRLKEHKPRSQEHSPQRFSFPTFLISQIQLNIQNFIPNISLKAVNQNPTKSTTKQHITDQTNKTQLLCFHKFHPKSSNHKSQQTLEADLCLKLNFFLKKIQKPKCCSSFSLHQDPMASMIKTSNITHERGRNVASMIKTSNIKTPTNAYMLIIGRGRSLRGRPTTQIT